MRERGKIIIKRKKKKKDRKEEKKRKVGDSVDLPNGIFSSRGFAVNYHYS